MQGIKINIIMIMAFLVFLITVILKHDDMMMTRHIGVLAMCSEEWNIIMEYVLHATDAAHD